MKIYASRNNRNDLDEFIGKDLWILAEITTVAGPNEKWIRKKWVRIIDKKLQDNDIYYIVNTISSSGVSIGYLLKCDIEEHVSINANNIRITKPIQMQTSDEIFGDNNSRFRRLGDN